MTTYNNETQKETKPVVTVNFMQSLVTAHDAELAKKELKELLANNTATMYTGIAQRFNQSEQRFVDVDTFMTIAMKKHIFNEKQCWLILPVLTTFESFASRKDVKLSHIIADNHLNTFDVVVERIKHDNTEYFIPATLQQNEAETLNTVKALFELFVVTQSEAENSQQWYFGLKSKNTVQVSVDDMQTFRRTIENSELTEAQINAIVPKYFRQWYYSKPLIADSRNKRDNSRIGLTVFGLDNKPQRKERQQALPTTTLTPINVLKIKRQTVLKLAEHGINDIESLREFLSGDVKIKGIGKATVNILRETLAEYDKLQA